MEVLGFSDEASPGASPLCASLISYIFTLLGNTPSPHCPSWAHIFTPECTFSSPARFPDPCYPASIAPLLLGNLSEQANLSPVVAV